MFSFQNTASHAIWLFLSISTVLCSQGIKASRSNIASFVYDVFAHPNVVAEGKIHASFSGTNPIEVRKSRGLVSKETLAPFQVRKHGPSDNTWARIRRWRRLVHFRVRKLLGTSLSLCRVTQPHPSLPRLLPATHHPDLHFSIF